MFKLEIDERFTELYNLYDLFEYITRIDYVEPIVREEYKQSLIKAYREGNQEFEIVHNKLLRLEVLEDAVNLIKKKKVNMYHIWAFDNYQQYKEHYPFAEYHAYEDRLTEEEFNMLKEAVFNEIQSRR